ncbi:MAG: tRNA 5-methoxyuridine(34)/uridine 5-oxyacetic acid(34) synthase CmoB [Chitinivibrionales bacterium]|nr:tRNA 5-methoxyuridine(34)/uridine 5-oxyacetic acid(34) synthase CmoB [Chitinivibrionales bacterium]
MADHWTNHRVSEKKGDEVSFGRFYEGLLQAMVSHDRLQSWTETLTHDLERMLSVFRHKNIPAWHHLLETLPLVSSVPPSLTNEAVTFTAGQCSENGMDTVALELKLKQLHPWREGPYDVAGVPIDSEWRSEFKWNRLIGHIDPLEGKTVLDVGCGNGYHCWRMVLNRAALAIGIDPYLTNVMQFFALKHFSLASSVFVLPMGLESIPISLQAFDTVFSMGVLNHRRSPIDHLNQLGGCLRPGGQLVLETMVIDGTENSVLVPQNRYAKMANIWFIPSPHLVLIWLKRCGFIDDAIVDVSTTTTHEQRRTAWMTFESLQDFLDKKNNSRTFEGLPAPKRALIIARKALRTFV